MLTRLFIISLLCCTGVLFGQDSLSRPNVLFILCDDLVDLQSPVILNNAVQTPHIDSLRSRGVDFANAVANSPICAPSRASMFTGIYPHNSGYYGYNMENDKVKDNTVLSEATDMFRAFSEGGYAVCGYGKLYHGDIYPDQSTKFLMDEFVESDRGPWAADSVGRKGHSAYPSILKEDEAFSSFPLSAIPDHGSPGWFNTDLSPFYYSDELDRDSLGDEVVTAKALERLETLAQGETPFFMAMGYRRPHTPYYVPDEFYERYPLDSVDISHVDLHDLDDVSLSQKYNRSYGISGFKSFDDCLLAGMQDSIGPASADSTYWIKQYIRGYFASVSFIDDQIGKLLDGVRTLGLDSNTIVILTSDHGIHLGDKLSFHKNTLWSNSLQVPFFVSGPGFKVGQAEQRPISLIDIYPTLQDYCQLDSALSDQLDGYTLRPLLDTLPEYSWQGPGFAVSAAASNELIDRSDLAVKEHQNYALSVGDFRYILSSSGENELYLNFDPMDLLNLGSVPELQYHKDQLHQDLVDFVGLDIDNDVAEYLYYGDFDQDLNGWTLENKEDTALFKVVNEGAGQFLSFHDETLKQDILFRNQHLRLDPFVTDYAFTFKARTDSELEGAAFRVKLEYVKKSFLTERPCDGHTEVLVQDYELDSTWYTYSTSFHFDLSAHCDGEFRLTIIPLNDAFDLDALSICAYEDLCDEDCAEFLDPPVELTKNYDPINGVSDRIRLKWYKEEGLVRYSVADSASCDIQFWPVKDLSSGYKYEDPDKRMLSQKYVRKPGKELYKWPLRFSRADIYPSHRYQWRVRCYCKQGKGIASPWSETKYFNTPAFDPETGLFYPDSAKKLIPALTQALSLYPNPAADRVYFEQDSEEDIWPLHIVMYDLSARQVGEQLLINSKDYLDTSRLPDGLYTLRITGMGEIATRPLVIHR